MKKLIIITMLLFSIVSTSQDRKWTMSLFSELADVNTHNEGFDYGFNFGIQGEYQMQLNYFDVELYVFPEVNDLSYTHLQFTLLGFHSYPGTFEELRLSLGAIKIGGIWRGGQGMPYPMFGSDLGIEFYPRNSDFYIGLEGGLNYCYDDKYWNSDTGHLRTHLRLRIGLTF